MNKSGIIEEHSKIKLNLYKLYLENFLSVLMVSNSESIRSINIIDLFAGCGISKNDEDGSALIAAKIIQKKINSNNARKIYLNLNEANSENFKELRNNIGSYNFASITCENADNFVQKWRPQSKQQTLFFIDPFGYTQISKENLRKIFQQPSCDFLIFIPIHHIYRFLNPKNSRPENNNIHLFNDMDQEIENEESIDLKSYHKPIAKFLESFDINKESVKNIQSSFELAELIKSALMKVSKKTEASEESFVYCEIINSTTNDVIKYGLFFLSHHILGAAKFLDAQKKLKEIVFKSANQRSFQFLEPHNKIDMRFMDIGKSYSNVELYERSIRNGIHPSLLINRIKELEKLKSSEIAITEVQGKVRINKGLYLDYKHFKSKNAIVSITRS